jgi:hypothetical protein
MAPWFSKKPKGEGRAPAKSPANPGVCVTGNVSFTRAGKSWGEEINTVRTLERVLKALGHKVTAHDSWLEDRSGGLVFLPMLVEIVTLDDGGVRTVSTIETSHPEHIRRGVFEYQHSAGSSVEDALSKGFDQWARTDLVTLIDALLPRPQTCMMMGMKFAEAEDRPARYRRAVLGPVAHFATHTQPQHDAGHAGPGDQGEAHPPFCACCLLTNSFLAFKDLIEGDDFLGIRLYAARSADGEPQADCRVNGEDWEAGAAALREYVTKWPGEGLEFRKQYVVVQSRPLSEAEGPPNVGSS